MLRAVLRRSFVTVALVSLSIGWVPHEVHADAGHCDYCNCSASALDENWHWGTCAMGEDCSLHWNIRCTNIGGDVEG